MSGAGTITADAYGGGALLVVDGEFPPAPMIARLRGEHAPVVATDGAALRLRDLEMLPDVIIGDLDTIGREDTWFAAVGIRLIRLESQESNDLEKALAWLAVEGITTATLIGVAGRAVDHTLNNFSVIARFARILRLRLLDACSRAYIVSDAIALDVTPGDRISLLPLPAAVLSTSGLAWPLRDERLEMGIREGASNCAVEPRITLHVREGVVIVFHFPATAG